MKEEKTNLVAVQCKKCLHIDHLTAQELLELLRLTGYIKDECSDKPN